MIIIGPVLLGSCCCCLFCCCLYRKYKARHSPEVAVVGPTHPKATLGIANTVGEEGEGLVNDSNLGEEGEGKVYDTNLGYAKEIYPKVTIPDRNERKENTYIINVGLDVQQLGLTFTDGVVSECVQGGYADRCNVSVGHTLISANDLAITELSSTDFLKVLQSRPLKLVFSNRR